MNPLVRHVDAIHIDLTIMQYGRDLRMCLPTDLLLQPDDNYDLDNCSFAVVPREPDDGLWLSPEVLAGYFDRAYFCTSDDRECDSFDTQLRGWQEASYTLAVRTVQGAETATRVAIEQAFNQHVGWLIPRGTIVTLTYVDNGATAVIVPNAAIEA